MRKKKNIFHKIKSKGWDVLDTNNGLLIAEGIFDTEMKYLDTALSSLEMHTEENVIRRGGGKSEQTQNLTKKLNDLGWYKNRVNIKNFVEFSTDIPSVEGTSLSHEIDHIGFTANQKNKFTLEIEWNNKDEFFDRDFQSMTGLFDLNIIELGIIVTRGKKLEAALRDKVASYFKANKVKTLNDFSRLQKKLKGKYGNDRFSFPSPAQKNDIKKGKSKHGFIEIASKKFCDSKYGSATTTWRQLNERVERGNAKRTPMIFLGIPPSVLK